MRNVSLALALVAGTWAAGRLGAAPWPAPASPVIPEADGYVVIPNAAVPPAKNHVYRAIYNATQKADAPNHLLPALNMAGSELNALGAAGVPIGNAKFVVVFHDAAMDGILSDSAYRAKFKVPNPNLPVLRGMKKAGVKLYVCGQNVAFARVDPKSIAPEVAIASDALIVLMAYQNQGYALLSF